MCIIKNDSVSLPICEFQPVLQQSQQMCPNSFYTCPAVCNECRWSTQHTIWEQVFSQTDIAADTRLLMPAAGRAHVYLVHTDGAVLTNAGGQIISHVIFYGLTDKDAGWSNRTLGISIEEGREAKRELTLQNENKSNSVGRSADGEKCNN